MVLFFTSTAVTPSATIYMGRDKVENEDLIKYAYPQDVWFHVDKLSSAHVYLRMSPEMVWDAIPPKLLTDCAQLVKANSIEGNKKDNLTIIYTPADNLKAGTSKITSTKLTLSFACTENGRYGSRPVSFHNDKRVKRVHIPTRENPIVNRLNKTKVERVVDHEQDRVDRLKKEGAERRAKANEKKKADLELSKAREAEKAARSYDSLFNVDPDELEDASGGRGERKTGRELEEDFM